MTDLYELTITGTVSIDGKHYYPGGPPPVPLPDPLPEGWSLRKVGRDPGWYLDPKNNQPWWWDGSEWHCYAFPDRSFPTIAIEQLVRLVPLDGPKEAETGMGTLRTSTTARARSAGMT